MVRDQEEGYTWPCHVLVPASGGSLEGEKKGGGRWRERRGETQSHREKSET